MSKDELQRRLPVFQAYAAGKTIQHKSPVSPTSQWSDGLSFSFCDPPECYRIKPEPRRFWLCEGYRFHTEEEALKHNLTCGAGVIPVVEVL